MNRKRIAMTTVCAILLIAPSAVVASEHGFLRPRGKAPCSVEGSWVTGFVDSSGAGLESDTLVPLDPAGAKLAFRGSITNPFLWTPFAPNAAVLSAIVGTFMRTTPRTYKFTMVMHAGEALPTGTPGRARITSLGVGSGTAECGDENTLVLKGTFAIFSAIDVPEMGIHNQDNNHDGFPDAGEVPIVSLPIELVSKRVQIQEPYPVTP